MSGEVPRSKKTKYHANGFYLVWSPYCDARSHFIWTHLIWTYIYGIGCSAKFDLTVKLSNTCCICEGSVAGVYNQMLGKGNLLMKAFPTLGTFIGLLRGVDLHVLSQVWFLPEALPTFSALMTLFPHVSPAPEDKPQSPTEAVPIVQAAVGSFTCVGPLMHQKVESLGEPYPALEISVGRSPMWVIWCFLRYELRENSFPQSGHL